MGRKGGNSRLKRQMAPSFWQIRRKESRFVVRSSPGPYKKQNSYPLAIVLRDILKVASTLREARKVLNEGTIRIDGKVVYDYTRAVGLMDVIQLVKTGQTFRLVPKDSRQLVPLPIDNQEKNSKLVRVTSKTTIKRNKLQYGFHDGKTVISDLKMSVGDSCRLELPQSEIKDHIKFQKGYSGLIIGGENAGGMGKIEDIKDGLFSLPKRVVVALSEKSVELPVDKVMVIGDETPIIKVS
jgi:small subunit ribosomal protein S4e